MDNETTQLIEAYLLGQLDEAAAAALEARAANDPTVAQALALQKDILSGIKHWGDAQIRARIAQTDRALFEQGFFDEANNAKMPPEAPRKAPWPRILLACALLAVCSFGLWRWMQTDPAETDAAPVVPEKPQPNVLTDTQPIATAPSPRPVTPPDPAPRYLALARSEWTPPDYAQIRSAAAAPDAPIRQAGEAFQKGDYAAVVRILRPLVAQGEDWQAMEMYAHAAFLSGNVGEATKRFGQIAASGKLPFSERSEWFLCLCYVARYPQDAPKLTALLGKITSDDGHPYYEAAQRVKARMTPDLK